MPDDDVTWLQRIVAKVAHVTADAPLPWRPVERSHLDHHGRDRFDPDRDVDRDAFDRHERKRGQQAAWRGVVDAEGRPVAGQSLAGGWMLPVVDPVWLFFADAPTTVERLLDLLREAWRRNPDSDEGAAGPQHADTDPTLAVTREQLARAAQAAYEAATQPLTWAQAPQAVKDEWHVRIVAAFTVAGLDVPPRR